MIKKILLGLAAVLVIIQFIRPAKNDSNDESKGVSTKYNVPTDVAAILKVACNDCHSNKTEYPWYANVQPVLWWLDHHIDEGKRELNFSTLAGRKIAIQNHKFEEIIEMVEKKEMPLPSYTNFGLHAGANLTEAQRQTLITWAKTNMDSLKAQYPADSLILKRSQGPTPAK
jgi:Haem-binding domain